MRVLITGAAGKIGSALVEGMKERHELRGLDIRPMAEPEDAIVGDIAKFDIVLEATKDMEAVLHLGGIPSGSAPWEEILRNNIIGTYNVFEAARQHGVRRVAYASRAGVLGPYPKTMQRTVDLLPRPESYYSISKVFGESLGYMYSSQYDMGVVAVRIGNWGGHGPPPKHPHNLSRGDAVRVFEQAIVYPGVKFEIVFGVSDSDWPLYDLDHGRRVGRRK